jgi:hypothetical protein
MAVLPSIRNWHRWFATAFTVTVLANVASAVVGGPTWVGYVALAPLILLMFSGWYLLWVTSGSRRRRGERQRVA